MAKMSNNACFHYFCLFWTIDFHENIGYWCYLPCNGLIIVLRYVTNYFKFSFKNHAKLISNRVNTNWYDPHEQKFWGSQFFSSVGPKTKKFESCCVKNCVQIFNSIKFISKKTL